MNKLRRAIRRIILEGSHVDQCYAIGEMICSGDVETMYHRSCRPIKEFGGYGVRWGFGNNGRAFLVSGAEGIQLLLKGGGKVFIGSKEANHFIESVSEIYPEKLRPDVSLSDT